MGDKEEEETPLLWLDYALFKAIYKHLALQVLSNEH